MKDMKANPSGPTETPPSQATTKTNQAEVRAE